MVAAMSLEEEIAAIGEAARGFAADGEEVVGMVPAEPEEGRRVYLCAYATGDARRWLALDANGEAISDRRAVRAAVSIAALCEIAEENAGGGDLPELRSRLLEIRLTDNPEGIGEAETAAADLEGTIEPPPRVASAAYLDAIGAAATRLEQALGGGGSPFAEAMKVSIGAAEELAAEVERSYKSALS